MPLHLNPNVKGKHVKLGLNTWVRVADILSHAVGSDAQGRRLVVNRKGGLPPIIYRGKAIDYCKAVLDKELNP